MGTSSRKPALLYERRSPLWLPFDACRHLPCVPRGRSLPTWGPLVPFSASVSALAASSCPMYLQISCPRPVVLHFQSPKSRLENCERSIPPTFSCSRCQEPGSCALQVEQVHKEYGGYFPVLQAEMVSPSSSQWLSHKSHRWKFVKKPMAPLSLPSPSIIRVLT